MAPGIGPGLCAWGSGRRSVAGVGPLPYPSQQLLPRGRAAHRMVKVVKTDSVGTHKVHDGSIIPSLVPPP